LSNPSSNSDRPRLLSFSLDGWDVLGDRVTVSLTDGVAVLVGRNGAGKSALLEGFMAISAIATGRFNQLIRSSEESIPKKLEVQILIRGDRQILYKYELITLDSSKPYLMIEELKRDGLEENLYSWNDCCQYMDGDREIVWTTEAGNTTIDNKGDKSTISFEGTSAIGRFIQRGVNYPLEMLWVYIVLSNIRLHPNNQVRETSKRQHSVVRVSGQVVSSGAYQLVNVLAFKIIRLMQTEGLIELESICQRIGIANNLTVQKFFQGKEPKEKDEEDYFASVLLDGVNIGLLSGGTLRVLSILTEIIASHPSATIMLEEPEMQIHPGMLAKLLNEIETYTFGENLILSTHSPQVVAWTSPDKVNLVHRNKGKTFIQKLNPDEIQRVYDYLAEEGDLGEWVYSGILDE
jgi:ABC-type branched-subunit amino acid transport system ATPase component